MTLEQLSGYFKTQTQVCEALGITRSSYSHWIRNGYIPYKKQYEIQKITNNKLKADYKEIHEALKNKFNI